MKASAFREFIRSYSTPDVVDTAEALLQRKCDLLEARLKAAEADRLTCEAVRREIYGISENPPKPPEWLGSPEPTGSTSGVPVVVWSDFHYGEVVNPDEVGGVNTFDIDIAKARIKKLASTTIDLAFNHMVNPDYPGLVVCLGGDMISGNIHEELRETNQGFLQQIILSLQDELCSALGALASAFGRLFIPCVVGNHGRTTMKPRMKGRVFESYEWNLYCQIARHFKNDPRVTVFIPNETDAHFRVCGHRFLLTHGDALGVKGGDGIIGALGPIMRGRVKVSNSEAQIGRDFDTLIMGHWHQYIALPGLIVNGTLKGYDEFTRLALRAPYSPPTQAMFFVHPAHGITANWPIYLDRRYNRPAETSNWIEWRR